MALPKEGKLKFRQELLDRFFKRILNLIYLFGEGKLYNAVGHLLGKP